MKWEIEFYQDSQGNIPVQDFISQQPTKVKAKFIHYIDMLQDFGLSLGQPYVKKLKDDVWELKDTLQFKLLPYIIFCNQWSQIHFSTYFFKKTKETPKSEIEVAKYRINDYKQRYCL